MKILITSIGRRVELVQAFHSAARRLNIDLLIYGADVSATAPALMFCDKKCIVPRIADAGYIPALVDICRREKIDALVPTIDTDLLILAENKAVFAPTEVFVSAPEKIAVCRDKRKTAVLFHEAGLKTPQVVDDYREYKSGFPAFIKPKDGSSSINAFKVNTKEELTAFAGQLPGYIIQPFIEGTEYTVDIFCDAEGNPLLITPRIRLAVRTGEVIKTQISQDKKIISEARRLVEKFKPYGQVTVQLIRERGTGDDYFIEINPRFGGGAPLSIKAGADSAEMLLRLLRGEHPEYMEAAAEDGATYSRYDQSVRVC